MANSSTTPNTTGMSTAFTRQTSREDEEDRLPMEEQTEFGGGRRGCHEGNQQDSAGEHLARSRGRALSVASQRRAQEQQGEQHRGC